MTHLSRPTDFRPGLPADRLERLIALARLVIAFERILPRLLPALGLAGLFAVAALLGLFAFLPWPLHALILAGTITGIGILLDSGFAGFAYPDWDEGARCVERDSRLAHRPISEGRDVLAAGERDDFAILLWRLHRARDLSPVARLRLSPPHADLQTRDPRRLRYGMAALLLAALIFARGEWRHNLLAGFGSGDLARASLDAWIDPPAYTGLAPLYLNPRDAKTLSVPRGSILNLRVHGAGRTPGLALGGDNADKPFEGDHGEYADNVPLAGDGTVRVRAGGHVIGHWNLHVIADHPPSIAFSEAPSRTEHDAVKFAFAAKDDYGVRSVRAVLRPHGRSGEPLIVDLPLSEPNAKTLSQNAYADLTANPYAGLEMDVTLEARDGAGQTGVSHMVRFHLPARIFTNPLARALIEQRQNLASLGMRGRPRVIQTLDALSIAPELFYSDRQTVYLGLRSAYWTLYRAHDAAALKQTEDLLWQIAVSLEQGGLLAAAQELRQLQQLLSQALAQGAPQDEIDALLQRYQDAMRRYLESMTPNPSVAGAPSPPDTKMLGPQDLGALLKAIQQLSQSGDRAQAAQMLALLQNILENLRMTEGNGSGMGMMSPQDKALGDAIGKLGELMGRQRGLIDKTFREKLGHGDPGDGGAKGLAAQQGALENDLRQLQGKLDKQQGGKLGAAGNAMGQARKDLGGRDLDNAGADEKDALERMRQTADALSRQLAQHQQSGQTQQDPLGRGVGGSGGGVKIPQASDMARARTILRELRKRAGERNRPQRELDYIDRLLKQF
jgi:uncharacterized protein (TIGR02302 family)